MPLETRAVLIVDDERSARDFCKEILKNQGFQIELADSGERALEIMENQETDIVLTDVRMPGMDGIELLKEIKRRYPGTDVVVMTGFGSIESAVTATKLGAYDYITKPFKVEDFRRAFRRLADMRELAAENKLLKERLKTQEGFANMVGASPRIHKIYRLISKAAGKRHPVLILGESGTGKELVARAIHNQSPWCDRPFVPIDCGALAPTLIESELFGHVRGAFTGATQNRIGLLVSASGGTVFLDEIAELPVELQVKLLRTLQEGDVKPIGSNERTRMEARVIAATNQDVETAIKRGSLRKDLYFRLNVVSIKMPPLRERKSDIPTLVHYFIEKYRGEDSRVPEIAYDAMARLMSYNWPGNVRELENCVQRALVLGSGSVIHARDLPSNVLYQVGPAPENSDVSPLGELERRAILQALRTTGGDRLRAAKLLGIGKTTIYRKLKEFDLEAEEIPESS